MRRLGYHRDDEGDRTVIYFGEPIFSGYVLIRRDHLANVTSLEHQGFTVVTDLTARPRRWFDPARWRP